MQLRPYQQEALDALFNYFTTHTNPEDNPVVAMPTGTGKSPVIASFCHKVLGWWPGQRILCLVHVKELVEQNANTMRRIWPAAPVGVFSAGLKQRVAHMPITFAGIKSVASNLGMFGRQDIIVVDEAHLIPEEDESEYGKVLAYFRALNPHLRVVGLSATPFRMGLGLITDGKLFKHVCYDVTGLNAFNKLLDDGYLCPLIPIRTETVIDVTDVGKRGGDFIAGQLERAVNREELTRAALLETVRAAADRNHWLVFTAGVQHAEDVAEALRRDHGISAAVVHGKMSNEQRDGALRAFKAGEVRALVNNNILTTGFDFPALDCIVALRPTNSVVLHVQILGRGTRPFYMPGYDLGTREGRLAAMAASPKRNCLVLDFAGNVSRLGPINDPRIPKRKGEGAGDVPVKVCDECGCQCHISARFCDNCGTAFQIQEKITEKASTAEIIAKVEPPRVEIFDVAHVTYQKQQRSGKPPHLRASYYCGVQRFTEAVCLEHHGSQIIHKAKKWWEERSPAPVPYTIDEAVSLQGTLRPPRQIKVWVNKPDGHPQVMSHIFEEPSQC